MARRGGHRLGLTGIESAPVLDARGKPVAKLLEGEIVLSGGERLAWKLSGLLPRCRIGEGLWVAKLGTMRSRRFTAELSPAMLAREDLYLLTGLAAVLTYSAEELHRSRTGAAGSFGW